MTGAQLKKIRKRLKLSLAKLGRATHYTPQHIQNMEAGRRKVSRRMEMELLLIGVPKVVKKHFIAL